MQEPVVGGIAAVPSKIQRRTFLQGVGAIAGAAAFPIPAVARGVSGDIQFATFEWTLPHTGSVIRHISQTFSEKYPNASVKEVPIPSTGFHDQILTQLTAGTPPDIFRIDDPQMALYKARDYLEPLDDVIAEAGIDPATFAAAGKDAMLDGKTYAIVYQTNARQMIFNNALLSEAGVAAAPNSLEEFEAAVQATTDRSKGQFGYTFASKSGDATGLFMTTGPIIYGFGGGFTNENGEPTATDPRVIEALSLLKRMWDANAVPRGLDGPAANKLIFDGKVALSMNGSFVFGASAPEVRPHLNAARSPLPDPSNVMRATSWYGVAKDAKNKDAAKAWLMHMLTAESQAKIVEVERVVPAIPSLVPASVFEVDPWFRTFVDAAATAHSYLPSGLGETAFAKLKVISAEVEQVLYANKNIETAMADLQSALTANR